MDWTLSEKFRFQAGKVGPTSEAPLRLKEVSNRLPWILREPQDELKACERIFLFKFRSAWGFASEHSLYVSWFHSREGRARIAGSDLAGS